MYDLDEAMDARRGASQPWCSRCECYEEDCICGNFNESEPLVRSGNEQPLVQGERQHVSLTAGEIPAAFDLSRTESFSAWLDSKGDALAAPDSFSDWLQQHDDRS